MMHAVNVAAVAALIMTYLGKLISTNPVPIADNDNDSEQWNGG
tara:strand:- start:615 stop:743 length:129 start_codon:yes stop_codon:yes gene_type:complete